MALTVYERENCVGDDVMDGCYQFMIVCYQLIVDHNIVKSFRP